MMAALAENWVLVLAGLVGLTLVIWTWQEREEDRTATDTGLAVGDRARRVTGGVAGFSSALAVGILGGLYEAGMSFSEFGQFLGDVVAASPMFVAGLVSAGLGALGMEGIIVLTPLQYLGLALLVLGGGAIIAGRNLFEENAEG